MALSLLIGGVVMATDDKDQDFVPLDVQPEMIKQVNPVYPAGARKEGVGCELWIKALVDTSGNVAKAEVAKTSKTGYGFEKAALKAAKQSTFKPGIQKGRPVAAWVTYKVVFSLDDCK